jgi:hypothetical protein
MDRIGIQVSGLENVARKGLMQLGVRRPGSGFCSASAGMGPASLIETATAV